MVQHHIHTFSTTKDFVDRYNEGSFGVPYIAAIKGVQYKDKPVVLYSNRLPYKKNEIEAPAELSEKAICNKWLLGASSL